MIRFLLSAFVAGLLAHQSDRVVRGLDDDVQLLARYTIGTLTIMAVASVGLPAGDRARVVRVLFRAAVGVWAGVSIGRLVDRLRI